jgi:hypothetical protein
LQVQILPSAQMKNEQFTYEATAQSTRYHVDGPDFVAEVMAHGWLITESSNKRLAFLIGKPRRALIEYARRKKWIVETTQIVMA